MTLRYIFIVRTAYALEHLLCVLLFASSFPKREGFPGRCLAAAFTYLAVMMATVGIGVHYAGPLSIIFITVLLYVGLGFWLYFCWKASQADSALCLCAAVATQVLMGRLTEILYLLAGTNPYQGIGELFGLHFSNWIAWLIYVLVHLSLALGIACLFRGKPSSSKSIQYSQAGILYSVCVCLSTIVLQCISRPLEMEQPELAWIIRLLAILWSVLILVCRHLLRSHANVSEELRMTQLLLRAERKQYESIKDDMQLINIKCHDIRHQLDQYAGRLTSSELEELRHMIQIYDRHMNTGNEILDMVLYKKQAILEQKHIRFTALSDARRLTFMEATDVYSLMNNAIDNAIEAVSSLEEPRRLISLQIRDDHDILHVHLTNYTKLQEVGDAVFQTTKKNPLSHGYGLLSIRYVVQKYDGIMSIRTEDGLFHLNICLPIPE